MDRSPLWIAFLDMALAMLAVVIVAVNPPKQAEAGVKQDSLYLLTITWSSDVDADADNWLLMPDKKPLFYASRDVGCGKLDSDYRGFMDEHITLADGSMVKVPNAKEVISLRCVQPGSYQWGTSLYAYRGPSENGKIGLHVHAEIIGLNPAVHTVFAKDVALDRIGETVNLTGFDLHRDGTIKLTEPALEPITDTYQRMKIAPNGKPPATGYTP